MPAVLIHVTGVVQGVGYRPFVYNLAHRSGVHGWVRNSSDGVWCHAEASTVALLAFERALADEAPPMAVVTAVVADSVPEEGFEDFTITLSHADAGAMTLVSPDVATCPACRVELADPADRRYRFPFINCTNCGPRFTVIDDVPYDRPLTTMRDFPMCPECAAEYGDPADRRFHAQPDACFVCGPRLYLNGDVRAGSAAQTVLADAAELAADPALTSPRAAELAADPPLTPPRAAELAAGPALSQRVAPALPADAAWSPEVELIPRPHRDSDAERLRSDAIIAAAADVLRNGGILALKGLGGFQLACDATDDEAVARLRERKRRWGKPLAVMMPSLSMAREYCEVSDAEEALLTSPAAPIVLLRMRGRADGPLDAGSHASSASGDEGAGAVPQPADEAGLFADVRRGLSEHGTLAPLAESLAPSLRELGVMLPYTPLHALLLGDLGVPLVMTSGNVSEEPIATGNSEALDRLADIADAFLLHDREIRSRYDDSVVRVGPAGTEFFRRARGYAPFPLAAPLSPDIDILACGPEQKNTVTLLTGDHAFVSQHIGDMENAETHLAFERTIADYSHLFRVKPAVVAYDLHPEYLSTKYAQSLGLPAVGVQHHHAHVVSVAAEHGERGPFIGVALDGTGYGEDGTIWGGEVLLATWTGFERLAHLAYLPLPGGAAAIRRPARMALGALAASGLLEHPGASALRSRLNDAEEATVLRMIERRINTPQTSSAGRLFDAVASLAGVRDDARYEGQAAIELEALADESADGAYVFGYTPGAPSIIESAPVLASVLDDLVAGVPAPVISIRFHRAVAAAIVDACVRASEAHGVRSVALAGGVFMNRLVLGGAIEGLKAAGLEPMTHIRLPANDGGVSFGQAIVARARQDEV
ncbi:MAG: carbamoyltransferase HypF [Coriobacteriia bacterium]